MTVTRFSLNTKGRDYAVGDIHGCFNRLQTVLDEMGFDPSKDRLFSVGDLVDRGPDCDQVLDWITRHGFTQYAATMRTWLCSGPGEIRLMSHGA